MVMRVWGEALGCEGTKGDQGWDKHMTSELSQEGV